MVKCTEMKAPNLVLVEKENIEKQISFVLLLQQSNIIKGNEILYLHGSTSILILNWSFCSLCTL